MRLPFWRTLAWRLTLAFVLVGALALGTVGVVSYAYTRSAFNNFLENRVRAELALSVQTYAEQNGTLQGFVPSPGDRGGDRPPPQERRDTNPAASFRAPFLVLDTQRRTLYATPDLPQGTRLTGGRAALATPVSVDGRVVAYTAPSGVAPELDALSRDFLARTSGALLWAMLAATLAAVLMGLLMARALLGPLRELLRGIQAMQRGEAPASSPHLRRDEFGQVLSTFHAMHHSVARNQQARRQLTANIAHDLNTPLSVIAGTLEGILDGTFKPTSERLAKLHRETRHVAGLVNDLRFLSLADAGELHLSVTPTDAVEVVRVAVLGVGELAARQKVRLSLRAPDEAIAASLDPKRITQVMQNLLSNALAHTPEGGEVEVTVQGVHQALTVRVRDTGSGIEADKLPHVFDRLYRADEARSTGGSGLGLSISKSIVEAHGGRISIDSAAGAGTTVTFTLPATPTRVHNA